VDQGRRFAKVVVGSGLAVGLAFGIGAIAQAQADDPSATTPDPGAPEPGAPHPGAPHPGAPQKRFERGGPKDGPRRGGFGMGMGIHGEFVVPVPSGGYQTIASQMGTVESVSATSITVKSEDGYVRSYAVDDNTIVHAGDNGIDDIATGDTVDVTAVVSGSTAKAVDIGDATAMGKRRGSWAPGAGHD
jgi:hypothetical protein